MVPMIIKGLFRKYESWNPVHPTYGAFWGMGVGVGCGIGWGPGFGPEVIGYVGAGCGVGFSVGITFAGVGIGLPTTNFIFQLPYNALTATTYGAMYFARSSGLLSIRNDAGNNGWDDAKVNRFGLQSFKHQQLLKKTVDFPAMNAFVSTKTRLILDCFDQLKSRVGHSR